MIAPFEARTFADFDTNAIISEVLSLTGSNAEKIYVANNSILLNTNADFEISGSIVFVIYIPEQTRRGLRYQSYQVQICTSQRKLSLFTTGVVDYIDTGRHVTLETLLNSLKYLPMEEIKNVAGNAADGFHIIYHGRTAIESTGESTGTVLYYNSGGITQSESWCVWIAVTPMYNNPNGGLQGSGADTIICFFISYDE